MTDTLSVLTGVAGGLALADPVEGAGVVAGGVVGLAAGLCESIARAALDVWPEARGAAVQAATLRTRAHDASVANARAYAAARAALAADIRPEVTGRDATLRAALVGAADTLLTLADAGADCVGLAAEVAGRCQPAVRPDAAGAAELAIGAVRVAAALVQANLALLPGDPRRVRAQDIVSAAEAQRARARDAVA